MIPWWKSPIKLPVELPVGLPEELPVELPVGCPWCQHGFPMPLHMPSYSKRTRWRLMRTTVHL